MTDEELKEHAWANVEKCGTCVHKKAVYCDSNVSRFIPITGRLEARGLNLVLFDDAVHDISLAIVKGWALYAGETATKGAVLNGCQSYRRAVP